tara:strand:+ start:1455 stop:1703 length:249 start_codon:yes stop_codon:yes gene_type:complete
VLGALFAIDMPTLLPTAVIQPFMGLLAALSTAIILSFDNTAIAQGRILRDATTVFAVSIESGGNGVEAALVLTVGVVAFPRR